MEMIGKLISGRYRLIAPLGEGGMATIWRAVDEQLDREVAVKLLREQYGNDPGFAARFKQEARAAGSLQHPNIVPVYDYGTDTDGAQYIVMQLVEGDDLAALLRERTRLETDDAVRVAIGVASALEAAHRRGLVHRDVKPGNILITDDGEVKVTDFGIARAVAEASMTVTGTTLGSVHYFSPEQARGDEVTGSSDVYSLGIVLYEMLTGRRPFEADSAAGVALKRLNEDPPPPESFVPVPSGLSAIVMRALQREPADRFPDAGSFAEALRTWQKDPAAAAAMVAAAGVAGAAAVAAVPPSGEPTVYVPAAGRPCHRIATPPPPATTAPAGGRGPAVVGLGAAGAGDPAARPDRLPRRGGVRRAGPGRHAVAHAAADHACPTTRGSRSPPSAPTWTALGWCTTRSGSHRTSSPATWSSAPIRRPAATVSEGDTDHGRHQQRRRDSGGAEPDRPDPDEATATLNAAGLQLGRRHRASRRRRQAGDRHPQRPERGHQTCERNSQVNLVLSTGPTPSPTPQPTPPPTPTPAPTADAHADADAVRPSDSRPAAGASIRGRRQRHVLTQEVMPHR